MKKKISSFILILLVVLVIGGVSYAFFNYFMEGKNSALIAGDIYMTLFDGEDEINIPNIFPETVMEARSSERHNSNDSTNNILTFLVKGNNDTEDALYYEILLNEGDEMEGKTRFNPEHLVFDLIEVVDNEEVLLQDAISYNELNHTKIWVDKVNSGESIDKTYKLRMWLSDEVTFGYGEGVTYDQEDYVNRYASVKIAVRADLEKKSFPSVIHTNDDYVENGVSYFRVNLSNDYLLEEEGNLLKENDEVRIVITNPENKLDFTYRDTEGNEEETKSSSIDKTYIYNKNKTITMVVYTQSKNDTNVSTTLNFKTYKNNELIQEYNKKVNVVGNNYCLNNGFTKLADCILVTENLAGNVNDAKTYINSKGAPNVNQTAPTYVYAEEITENISYTGTNRKEWFYGINYVFNSSTGTFRLYNDTPNDTLSAQYLSSDYIGYYTCKINASGYQKCGNIYKITSVDVENSKIYGTQITYKEMGSVDSQVGLYKAIDDFGDSYFFRGNVKNNNVSFGGTTWKIIRINGDGSLRLMKSNSISSSLFNNLNIAPTYNGYMYTLNNNIEESEETLFSDISSSGEYYFSDDYQITFDSNGLLFKLIGDSNRQVKKTLSDMNTSGDISSTPYTCLQETLDGTCETLYKVKTINSATSFTGNSYTVELAVSTLDNYSGTATASTSYYWGDDYNIGYDASGPYFTLKTNVYSPVSKTLGEMKDDTDQFSKTKFTCFSTALDGKCRWIRYVTNITSTTAFTSTLYHYFPYTKNGNEKNEIDSNAKIILDNWYKNTFSLLTNNDKPVTDYVVDNIFCNDRSIVSQYVDGNYVFNVSSNYQSGYLFNEYSYYSSYLRLRYVADFHKSAKLVCTNNNDKFSVSKNIGNGRLTYPVALITADEAVLAGALNDEKNSNFYLNKNIRTMTPGTFSKSSSTGSTTFFIHSLGYLDYDNVGVYHQLIPVINLKADTKIMLGDGTAANPYVIE